MFPGPLLLSCQYLPRQLLAELHAELVEAVDVPEHALGEDLVLVECDEAAQVSRTRLINIQHTRRSVPGVLLMRRQLVVARAVRERIGLRTQMRREHAVFGDVNEVGRRDVRALVQELVEGMLAHRAFTAP